MKLRIIFLPLTFLVISFCLAEESIIMESFNDHDMVVKEVKKYGGNDYIYFNDNSIWLLNPLESHLVDGQRSDGSFLVQVNYDYRYPYSLYYLDDGALISMIMARQEQDVPFVPENLDSLSDAYYYLDGIENNEYLETNYAYANKEMGEHALIRLQGEFYWHVEGGGQSNLTQWSKGDRIVIMMKVRDTGTRYAAEGYVAANLDKKDWVYVTALLI